MNSISVIIPSFNHEAYVAEAIRSVLAQTCPPDEIIVVDDASADRTAEVVSSFGEPVRLIAQENQGTGAARNTGLKEARGSLIAMLDSDDVWLERKLERQSAYLAAHPEADMVFCHMKLFLSPEIDPAQAVNFNKQEIAACSGSTLLARREVFDKAGLFPAERDAHDFFVWFGRACDAGLTYHILPELLFHRRVHLTNTVHDPVWNSRYARFLKERLDRKRASAAGQGEP